MLDRTKNVKISVRNLVEFILRSGDLDNTRARSDADSMQAGSRIHRKLQKQMGPNYTAEVPLIITVPVTWDDISFELTVEGRADGVINNNTIRDDFSVLLFEEKDLNPPEIIIDEIKGVYRELSHLSEPIGVHRAQAMCYAYIYATKYDHAKIGIRITYCNIETENLKYFDETFTYEELSIWFEKLTKEYGKWAVWQLKWNEKRTKAIKTLDFPFSYREGQKELVTGVYKTILRKKKLFIEAPTGVGKTISTVFPSVKAMGEGIVEKLFYLTAKTITRTVAEDTFRILQDNGLHLKVVTITAKEKICILDKPDCNPGACPRAKGYFDRVNDAVYDLLTNENDITRELIKDYATKHCVCPFEMCLDVSLWADAIICDYNYVFDPNVYLRRFFMNDKQNDYVFLIDEAHNLVERAREMYSAVLYKDSFLEVKRLIKDKSMKLAKHLDHCNNDLLKLRRDCDEFEVLDNINGFCMHLMGLMAEYEVFLQENVIIEGKDEVLKLYLDIRHFLGMHEIHDDNYTIYTDYDEGDQFRIKLQCMDPSRNLNNCLIRGRSAVLFSATLLPIGYYMEQLGGSKDDYAVYAPSSFLPENRLILIGADVSTKYTRRNEREYKKILGYIKDFTKARTGNYMVFFPSYQMLQTIAELAGDEIEGLVIQSSSMTETERELFLEEFVEEPQISRVGFCVMGGIFSEGIDLKSNRLIGAVIVGTGLPMVCNERELFRGYFDEKNGKGFDYAYLYQGMNKVLQSAGRVIRTKEDRGAILLLDERFTQQQYINLFPREWFPNLCVNQTTMPSTLSEFWERVTGKHKSK
ncbi:ATP-dependent DNA helicase [Mobilitalea sibirica]|uniref:ATP-dependent DNA helicase n=1 Tax=Mobilitalea sibirica TaxID=1462919 RepID=A0A8J7HE70_9FIRM|nr:ATP-dependent DNA helicase [Mobilitalea sibirica]MBH1941689.1 ATP-dependent DNA helicase [Mobilitalea sibirica]